jgi:hypothetical protein
MRLELLVYVALSSAATSVVWCILDTRYYIYYFVEYYMDCKVCVCVCARASARRYSCLLPYLSFFSRPSLLCTFAFLDLFDRAQHLLAKLSRLTPSILPACRPVLVSH